MHSLQISSLHPFESPLSDSTSHDVFFADASFESPLCLSRPTNPRGRIRHPTRTCHHHLCDCILDNLPYQLSYAPTLAIFSLLHPRFIPRSMLHTAPQQSSGTGTHAGSCWQPYNPTGAIASMSWSPVPYSNTPISAMSTSPPHSTHPNIRHTHCPPDITQRKTHQAANLIGKSQACRFTLTG